VGEPIINKSIIRSSSSRVPFQELNFKMARCFRRAMHNEGLADGCFLSGTAAHSIEGLEGRRTTCPPVLQDSLGIDCQSEGGCKQRTDLIYTEDADITFLSM
jgi:hypothetical protein